MDIGVVLQTTPPSARVIDLAKKADMYGFSHVWTFDSHILWQEPYVIFSQILAETRNVIVGPMVTNPATRDWTVTASTYATLNEMYGNRTVCGIGRGDSAVRVTNGKPTNLATLRESIHVIRELGNGRAVDYNGSSIRFPWASKSELEVWIAAYGPKALALTGEVGDGFILQLADADIAQWTIKAVHEAAERQHAEPDQIDAHLRRDRRARARVANQEDVAEEGVTTMSTPSSCASVPALARRRPEAACAVVLPLRDAHPDSCPCPVPDHPARHGSAPAGHRRPRAVHAVVGAGPRSRNVPRPRVDCRVPVGASHHDHPACR